MGTPLLATQLPLPGSGLNVPLLNVGPAGKRSRAARDEAPYGLQMRLSYAIRYTICGCGATILLGHDSSPEIDLETAHAHVCGMNRTGL